MANHRIHLPRLDENPSREQLGDALRRFVLYTTDVVRFCESKSIGVIPPNRLSHVYFVFTTLKDFRLETWSTFRNLSILIAPAEEFPEAFRFHCAMRGERKAVVASTVVHKAGLRRSEWVDTVQCAVEASDREGANPRQVEGHGGCSLQRFYASLQRLHGTTLRGQVERSGRIGSFPLQMTLVFDRSPAHRSPFPGGRSYDWPRRSRSRTPPRPLSPMALSPVTDTEEPSERWRESHGT